jgi:hypothetical protein
MKIQFELRNGSYRDHVEITSEAGVTIGQTLYRFFSAQIAKIVLSKKRGMLKGVSLRDPWAVSVVVDGKVFIDSVEVARGTALTQFNLKLSTSALGVERFRRSMCELTVMCITPFITDMDVSLENGFLLNNDTIARQIKDVMKMDAATVAEKIQSATV